MDLQAEVRHRSDDVLLDVVKAIRRRVRVINRAYDVPCIAGYEVCVPKTSSVLIV